VTAPEPPAVPDHHLVNAAAPAMRKLLRRVAAGQFSPDDAVDVLLDWPNLAAAVPDTGQADDPLRLRWEVQQLQGVVQDQHRAIAAVRALCADAMKLPTLDDPRPADYRISPRAALAALDSPGSPDTGQARVELRCDRCGRSSADSDRDMAAPVVFFVRQGLCHPCSRSTALPPGQPSEDAGQAREPDPGCQGACRHCGAGVDEHCARGCPCDEGATAEPDAPTVGQKCPVCGRAAAVYGIGAECSAPAECGWSGEPSEVVVGEIRAGG
jgi:hypothetical protein